jgi:hypothetical protein
MQALSRAPKFTQERLASYDKLVCALPQSNLRRYFEDLLFLADVWLHFQDTPARLPIHTLHLTGAKVTHLSASAKDFLAGDIPTTQERAEMVVEFDRIEDQEVRNAAFHLLWLATELSLGREPLTN